MWTDLGGLLANLPYVANLDPAAAAMTYGNYELRAVATDKTGNVDADPEIITIIYKDMTPPAVPLGLTALVDGGKITLTWQANTEDDLAGYILSQLIKDSWSDEEWWEPLNQALITFCAYWEVHKCLVVSTRQ